jgi:hypothetical protein
LSSADLERLAAALAVVEQQARGLPWAEERAWRVQSHLWVEGEVLVVDLHDLSVKLAGRAVQEVGAVAGSLSAGSVAFVTGVGRRSLGPPKLGRAVQAELARLCRAQGWSHAPGRAGRWLLILDGRRAPSQLGWPFWLGAFAFGLAALAFVPPLGVVVLLVLIAAWWKGR